MPMQRELYPPDWPQIAHRVKQEDGWKCQVCGNPCRRPGDPFISHRYTLTVAHLDHNPANCARENLKSMCAPCHLRYDAKHHAETRKKKKESQHNERV